MAARPGPPHAEITMTMKLMMNAACAMTTASSRRSLRRAVGLSCGLVGLTLCLSPLAWAGQDAAPAEARPSASALPGFDPGPMLEQLSSRLRAAQARTRSAQDRADRDAERRERGQGRQAAQRDRSEMEYERARQAIERAQWDAAVQQFTALAQAGVQRADAATYWRAYALDKMNRPAEALAAVAELLKNFPQSRWLGDGRALDLQMRQRAGQPASVASDDDELKLLAIQGLQNTAPERAVPMLLKVLTDAGSLRLKERALFVLAQSGSPQARTTLAGIARGGGNPELQSKAVQYLGMSGQPADVSLLADLYASATDLALKRQVLRAFMFTGDRQRVFALATTEKAPELRTEAVRQLGAMGAQDELWQLYQKESVPSIKRDMLGALGISGAAPRLIEVANTERDPELRVMAVRQLGIVGGRPAGDALVALYTKQTEPQLRRAAIDGLFVQGNVDALVSLARKETNPEMRRLLVQKISVMGSAAALDFLAELLNK